ncbi:MAG: MmgE/PrpD family protein, partial [Thermoplasmata archaeon]
NKETADHSMPYIIAYSLLHGDPAINSYDRKFLKDPEILSLIDKMQFVITEKFDSMYPAYLPVKITVESDSGRVEEEVDVPKGHFRDPYSWDDLLKKAIRVNDRLDAVVKFAKDLDKKDSNELMEVIGNVSDA